MNLRFGSGSAGLGAAVLALLALPACATWQAPAPFDDASLRARATTSQSRDVEVHAAVLGAEESRRVFGTDLEASGVQAVWIEVRNRTQNSLWLQFQGIDPDHFSAHEVAWSAHVKFGGDSNARIDALFEQLEFQNPVARGQTRSGFVYTNPQPSMKLVNIDLLGNQVMIPISLLVDVPGGEDVSERLHLLDNPGFEIIDHADLEALREALERLPHCASRDGSEDCATPLNLVLVGRIEDLGAAAIRRGYRRDILQVDRQYKVFGREPDYAARKHAQAGAPATWVRAWRAPLNYRGQPVYVAQTARPVGGRFAGKDPDRLQMHADIDEARNLYLQDAMYSGGLEAVGFLPGLAAVPESQRRQLEDGSSYFSDGHRAVLFFTTRPLTFSDVDFLDWVPLLQLAGSGSGQ